MNPEDIIRGMMGQRGGQQSVLLRQPTEAELEEFCTRCMREHDMNPQMLYNDIRFKLEPRNGVSLLSFEDAEIYPLVLDYLEKKYGGKRC